MSKKIVKENQMPQDEVDKRIAHDLGISYEELSKMKDGEAKDFVTKSGNTVRITKQVLNPKDLVPASNIDVNDACTEEFTHSNNVPGINDDLIYKTLVNEIKSGDSNGMLFNPFEKANTQSRDLFDESIETSGYAKTIAEQGLGFTEKDIGEIKDYIPELCLNENGDKVDYYKASGYFNTVVNPSRLATANFVNGSHLIINDVSREQINALTANHFRSFYSIATNMLVQMNNDILNVISSWFVKHAVTDDMRKKYVDRIIDSHAMYAMFDSRTIEDIFSCYFNPRALPFANELCDLKSYIMYKDVNGTLQQFVNRNSFPYFISNIVTVYNIYATNFFKQHLLNLDLEGKDYIIAKGFNDLNDNYMGEIQRFVAATLYEICKIAYTHIASMASYVPDDQHEIDRIPWKIKENLMYLE